MFECRYENKNATESSFSDLEKENTHPGEKTRPQPLQQQRKRPHLAQTTSHLAQREHHLAQTLSGTQGRVIPSRDFEANYSDNDGSSHGYNSDPYEGKKEKRRKRMPSLVSLLVSFIVSLLVSFLVSLSLS